jgi:cytoskeleton protein RodZ
MTQAKRSASRQRPWEQGADGAPTSFGTWLRRQRELREITLREIADASKISLRYLEALESDRFDLLPASVFARGFLREYARYVGLNPDEVVNHYLYAVQSLEPEAPAGGTKRPAPPARSASSATYLLLFLAALAVLIGLVYFASVWSEKQREEASPPTIAPPPVLGAVDTAPAPPVAAPSEPTAAVEEPGTGPGSEGAATAAPAAPAADAAPSPPAAEGLAAVPPAAAPPSVPLRVELDFQAECWYEARVDDGPPQSQTRIQGESLLLDAQRKVVLTLGNGGGVKITVNGRPFALEARSGEVVRDLVIDLAALGTQP